MNWHQLEDIQSWEGVLQESFERHVAVFKHSTRCSVSLFVKRMIESSWSIHEESLKTYFLDLIRYREVSNSIAENVNVTHESPQMLILKNGEAVYHASHQAIAVSDIKDFIEQQTFEKGE